MSTTREKFKKDRLARLSQIFEMPAPQPRARSMTMPKMLADGPQLTRMPLFKQEIMDWMGYHQVSIRRLSIACGMHPVSVRAYLQSPEHSGEFRTLVRVRAGVIMVEKEILFHQNVRAELLRKKKEAFRAIKERRDANRDDRLRPHYAKFVAQFDLGRRYRLKARWLANPYYRTKIPFEGL